MSVQEVRREVANVFLSFFIRRGFCDSYVLHGFDFKKRERVEVDQAQQLTNRGNALERTSTQLEKRQRK